MGLRVQQVRATEDEEGHTDVRLDCSVDSGLLMRALEMTGLRITDVRAGGFVSIDGTTREDDRVLEVEERPLLEVNLDELVAGRMPDLGGPRLLQRSPDGAFVADLAAAGELMDRLRDEQMPPTASDHPMAAFMTSPPCR